MGLSIPYCLISQAIYYPFLSLRLLQSLLFLQVVELSVHIGANLFRKQMKPLFALKIGYGRENEVVLLMVVMEQMVMEKNNKMWYKKQCGVEDV